MAARINTHRGAVAIAMLALLLASLGTNSSARAQAGSIGGSVGPTEKTLSGERSTAAPRAPAAAQPKAERRHATAGRGNAVPAAETAAVGSRCRMLLGSWSFSNGVGVVFKAGGGLSSTLGDSGTWSCDNGMVAAHWVGHWTDHYLVSSDGAHITGNSGLLNAALTATKN